MESTDAEFRRLKGLYAVMSDAELQSLLADRDGLTKLAQEALDAVASERGLSAAEVEAEDEAELELPSAEYEEPLVRLDRFHSLAQAMQATNLLEGADIPFKAEQPTDGKSAGGDGSPAWMDLYVAESSQLEAIALLREGMGWFPVKEIAEPSHDDNEAAGDELFLLGDFPEEADAELVTKALREAGIPFKAARLAAENGAGTSAGDTTFVEVSFDDLERATAVVEAVFVG